MAEHSQYQHGNTFNEFTLFHNPTEGALKDTWESFIDKMHRTTDISLAFSTVLKNTQDSNHETSSRQCYALTKIFFCNN